MNDACIVFINVSILRGILSLGRVEVDHKNNHQRMRGAHLVREEGRENLMVSIIAFLYLYFLLKWKIVLCVDCFIFESFKYRIILRQSLYCVYMYQLMFCCYVVYSPSLSLVFQVKEALPQQRSSSNHATT